MYCTHVYYKTVTYCYMVCWLCSWRAQKTPPVSHLLIGDGIGHVGWVDHGRNTAQESHSSVDHSEVVFLIFQ